MPRKTAIALFVVMGSVVFWVIAGPALAQDEINGVWSMGEEVCPRHAEDYERMEENFKAIRINTDGFGYLAGEGFGCIFAGGDSSHPRQWIMRGRCGEEGDQEGPLVQINALSESSVLSIDVKDLSFKFAIRCGK